MTNDVALAKLSAEVAGRIGTAARRASSDFHTCLMTEEAREVQEYSDVPGLLMTANNTCLKKHRKLLIDLATPNENTRDSLGNALLWATYILMHFNDLCLQ